MQALAECPLIFVALQQSLRVASVQIHDGVADKQLLIGEWGGSGWLHAHPSPDFDHRLGAVDSFSA